MSAFFTPDIRKCDGGDFPAVAADAVMEHLRPGTTPLVTLPTGNTPLGMYNSLLARYGQRRDIWGHVRFLTLDEYAGLDDGDPRLFYDWLRRGFLDGAGIAHERCMTFDSKAPNPAAEAARIALWLAKNGPLDLAVLGLGANGHLAFNEPGSPFDCGPRAVTLHQESISASAHYWTEGTQVPSTAMTLGLGDIIAAHRVILLVSGAHKAGILDRVLHGPVTPDVPATCLRTRPHVTIIADHAALSSPA